jgi:hypothetical protein
MQRSLVALLLLTGISITAYDFSFSNHMNEAIQIRIRLAPNAFEPWYESGTIHPFSEWVGSFPWAGTPAAAHADWDHKRKAGFCLQDTDIKLIRRDANGNFIGDIVYRKDKAGKETTEIDWDKSEFLWGAWQNVIFLWLPNEAYELVKNAIGDVVGGFVDVGLQIAGAATGGSTGGAAGGIGGLSSYSSAFGTSGLSSYSSAFGTK